jgi:hydrogenase nickel incorporation protein HypA/HybF
MHELAIASSIVETVAAEARRHGGAHVCRAGLRVGELAGVDAESLLFCLDLLVRDSPLAPLAFEIESIPQRRRCSSCTYLYVVEQYRPECPRCGSGVTSFVAGDELDLAWLEVDSS